MMTPFQRDEAVETLIYATSVAPDDIEKHEDYELQAWLDELGYVWNGNAWVIGDEESSHDQGAG